MEQLRKVLVTQVTMATLKQAKEASFVLHRKMSWVGSLVKLPASHDFPATV